MNTYNDIWLEVLETVRPYVSQTGFSAWLSGEKNGYLEFTEFENNTVYLHCPNAMKISIIKSQYLDTLKKAFEEVMGFPVEVELVLDKKPAIEPEPETKKENADIFPVSQDKQEQFTFETFVEGPSNKFAYRAAIAVAKDPGGHIRPDHSYGNYNPLFIYGKSGLGKTHILNAICCEIKKNFPDMKIVYLRSEDFLNEFLNALDRKATDDFHMKFRSIDVLLIDDIQFIAGKSQTEEEFFHTFNSLIENGKQIVLTSDRPPKEIQSLTERLVTRFESGILADIQSPEYETRCLIIKNKAMLLNLNISNEVVEYIANKIKTNIRQLEGTVKKLSAFNELTNREPTIALAQKVIKDVIDDDIPPIPVTVERIIEEVSRMQGVPVEDIKSTRQKANISLARKMCMYIMREVTTLTLEQIGEEFGKNYSTVIYSLKEISKKMEEDSKIERKINDIINNVKTNA